MAFSWAVQIMQRPSIIRTAFEGELVVDNFAGGGGASTGIEEAIGRPVDIAINHSPEAIAMHKANHPRTRHYCENIWEVDPVEACGGRAVGLAWFSPDCTHHSRAKGGKPRKKSIRALAWVVIRWAKKVRPRVIMIENVEEFASWGPLDKDGHPIKSRAGETFTKFVSRLSDLGYQVDVKSLVCADYGTPTTRKRLFLIARRDRHPVVWPEPTHGDGRPDEWIPASEIIDWELPCPSIFTRKKPLVEKTMRRIAAGIKRFVIDTGEPFIVPVTHAGGYNRGRPVQLPLPTVTGANRVEFALVSPSLIKYHGGEDSKAMRAAGVTTPIATIDTQPRFGLVSAFLSRYFGHSVGQGLDKPAPTVTAGGGGKTALVAATMIQTGYGERPGQAPRALDIERPLGTVVAGGAKHAIVAAFLNKHYTGVVGHGVEKTLGTVTSWDHHSLTHLALVVVKGIPYQIVDIGMRMLQPHELFAAQGFPEDYRIDPWYRGKPLTKTAQISLAGNAVPPQPVEKMVGANAA
jgi:DNA (cytosine-5)-methyltransferase 1